MSAQRAWFLILALGLPGCEVVAKFDRTKILPPTTKVPHIDIDAALIEPEAGTAAPMDAGGTVDAASAADAAGLDAGSKLGDAGDTSDASSASGADASVDAAAH